MVWRSRHVWILIIAFAACTAPAWTQQDDPRVSAPSQPLPPLKDSSSRMNADASDPGAVPAGIVPDNRPLSGAQQYGLGTPGVRRNILGGSVQFRETADTNSTSAPGGSSDIQSASYLTGNLAVRHLWRNSELEATYSGGGGLYNTRSDLNQVSHQVGFSERVTLRRWGFLLSDQASYLPESSFGFNGLGTPIAVNSGLGAFGSQFSNLNPLFDPNQSILTGRARRISNVVLGEVQYSVSARTSVTASASYGLLHFMGAGFIDDHNWMVRGGYNYALNPRDTLGLIYAFSEMSFNVNDSKIDNHSAQLAYGRRITGRLALQLSAGPQITTFRNVATNPGAQVSWSAGASLNYRRSRSNLFLSYLRGVTGGVGLFEGAKRDEVQAGVTRTLTRTWTGSLSAGYARNTAIGQLTQGLSEFKLNSWTAGAGLDRPLGRRMSVFLSYNFQHQDSDTSICITGSCGTALQRHQFGLGLNWTIRPIAID